MSSAARSQKSISLQSKVDALTKTNGALEKRLAEIEKTLKGHMSLLKDHQGQIIHCNLEIAKLQGLK